MKKIIYLGETHCWYSRLKGWYKLLTLDNGWFIMTDNQFLQQKRINGKITIVAGSISR